MSDVTDPLAWVPHTPEYGVKVRYPGDDPILAEARQAFEIAKSICLFARKLFGIR